jgi:hypothetical protein
MKNLIFISCGEQETFARYALDNLSLQFEVFICFYGDENSDAYRFLKSRSCNFLHNTGSKFNNLKFCVENGFIDLESYEYVWVCDDDLVPIKGDLSKLPNIMKKFGIDICSPAHSGKGKVSHLIMLPHPGERLLRITNFV